MNLTNQNNTAQETSLTFLLGTNLEAAIDLDDPRPGLEGPWSVFLFDYHHTRSSTAIGEWRHLGKGMVKIIVNDKMMLLLILIFKDDKIIDNLTSLI